LKERIELSQKREIERFWTLAWCAAHLNARSYHDPKKLPKTPNELWEKKDAAQMLAAAFGRPGGSK